MAQVEAPAPTAASLAACSRSAADTEYLPGRAHVSLNGRWSYIIDPYEMGYYDYRHMPFDQSATGEGGFYDDRKPKDKGEWVEYNFDQSPTLKIPGRLEFAGGKAAAV